MRIITTLIATSLLFVALAAQASAGEAEDKALFKERLQRQFAAEESTPIIDSKPWVLFREYRANEIAADNRYKGKWIEMEGPIHSVAKDQQGNPYLVFFADQHGIARVHARLFPVQLSEFRNKDDFDVHSSLQAAAAVQRGESVLVNCIGVGAAMGIPYLDQCLVMFK